MLRAPPPPPGLDQHAWDAAAVRATEAAARAALAAALAAPDTALPESLLAAALGRRALGLFRPEEGYSEEDARVGALRLVLEQTGALHVGLHAVEGEAPRVSFPRIAVIHADNLNLLARALDPSYAAAARWFPAPPALTSLRVLWRNSALRAPRARREGWDAAFVALVTAAAAPTLTHVDLSFVLGDGTHAALAAALAGDRPRLRPRALNLLVCGDAAPEDVFGAPGVAGLESLQLSLNDSAPPEAVGALVRGALARFPRLRHLSASPGWPVAALRRAAGAPPPLESIDVSHCDGWHAGAATDYASTLQRVWLARPPADQECAALEGALPKLVTVRYVDAEGKRHSFVSVSGARRVPFALVGNARVFLKGAARARAHGRLTRYLRFQTEARPHRAPAHTPREERSPAHAAHAPVAGRVAARAPVAAHGARRAARRGAARPSASVEELAYRAHQRRRARAGADTLAADSPRARGFRARRRADFAAVWT